MFPPSAGFMGDKQEKSLTLINKVSGLPTGHGWKILFIKFSY